MPKTEILNRLDTRRKDFVGGLEKLGKHTDGLGPALYKGPTEFGKWSREFVRLYQETDGHLTGMNVAIQDFRKRWESWQNPSFKSTIKNLFQYKKLQKDRETAAQRYQELTKDYEALNKSWRDIKSFGENYDLF